MLLGAEEWYTIVGAAAHSVTFDAGRASPFRASDDRHSGLLTAGCGRESGLRAAAR